MLRRVFAVSQVGNLLEDYGQPAGEHVAVDVEQVRGDLGVVSGHQTEGLGRQLLAKLGGNSAACPHLGDHLRVASRIGHSGHARVVAGRG